MAGMVRASWGLAGVILLLGSAVYRLTPLAVQAWSYDLHWYHWMFFAFVLLFMAYAEGYRAFQQGFSPRVAARARYLRIIGIRSRSPRPFLHGTFTRRRGDG
jgi:hypothetical protein